MITKSKDWDLFVYIIFQFLNIYKKGYLKVNKILLRLDIKNKWF